MRIAEPELRTALRKLFASAGLTEENAAVVTHCLMEAELAGIGTHGVAMTEAHLKKCRDGYDTGASLTVETEKPAFAVCHAHNMIGMLSAWQAMELAVEKAAESGMYAVFCHHANTFSAAYCYVRYAAEHGMISYVSCNSPAQMAPWGGKEKLLGTNPLAIGIPARSEKPFLFDMATSAVAKSKINQALHNGDAAIPFGWATDENGQSVTIPIDANGNVLKFPNIQLLRKGIFVEVYSRSGHSTPFEIYWDRQEAVWQSGETAVIRDHFGQIQATYRVP